MERQKPVMHNSIFLGRAEPPRKTNFTSYHFTVRHNSGNRREQKRNRLYVRLFSPPWQNNSLGPLVFLTYQPFVGGIRPCLNLYRSSSCLEKYPIRRQLTSPSPRYNFIPPEQFSNWNTDWGHNSYVTVKSWGSGDNAGEPPLTHDLTTPVTAGSASHTHLISAWDHKSISQLSTPSFTVSLRYLKYEFTNAFAHIKRCSTCTNTNHLHATTHPSSWASP